MFPYTLQNIYHVKKKFQIKVLEIKRVYIKSVIFVKISFKINFVKFHFSFVKSCSHVGLVPNKIQSRSPKYQVSPERFR